MSASRVSASVMAVRLVAVGGAEVRPAGAVVAREVLDLDRQRVEAGEGAEERVVVHLREGALGHRAVGGEPLAEAVGDEGAHGGSGVGPARSGSEFGSCREAPAERHRQRAAASR